MAGKANLAKLCRFGQTLKVCDTSGALPVAILFVQIFDSESNLIPTDSVQYNSTGTGFLGDGSGFIRSYYTDVTGNPIVNPVSVDFDCAGNTKEIEVGEIVDTQDSTFQPIPVRVEFVYDAAGNIVSTEYYSLIDGSLITLGANQEFDVNGIQWDIEVKNACVRNTVTGELVGTFTQVFVFDAEDVSDSSTNATPVSSVLLDSLNAEYVLGANEVIGSCDIILPEIFKVCLEDTTNSTTRPARQYVPVNNGILDYANVYYTDAEGNILTKLATELALDGECGIPCATCP